MTFVSRLVLVLAAAIVLTVAGVCASAFFASERVNEAIERSRVSNLLGTLRTTTEANLSIGLSLDQISLLQTMVEREKASDASILAIDVFNAAGRSLYSTDRSVIGERVGENWTSRLTEDGVWRTTERGDTVFGTRFENDLGVAGGISVTVSDLARIRRMELLGFDLTMRALVLTGIGLALAAIAGVVFAHVVTRPFERVARILRGEDVTSLPSSDVERLAVETRKVWAKAEGQVDRGLGQLGALDDAA